MNMKYTRKINSPLCNKLLKIHSQQSWKMKEKLEVDEEAMVKVEAGALRSEYKSFS